MVKLAGLPGKPGFTELFLQVEKVVRDIEVRGEGVIRGEQVNGT